jgi:hypothetical protein
MEVLSDILQYNIHTKQPIYVSWTYVETSISYANQPNKDDVGDSYNTLYFAHFRETFNAAPYPFSPYLLYVIPSSMGEHILDCSVYKYLVFIGVLIDGYHKCKFPNNIIYFVGRGMAGKQDDLINLQYYSSSGLDRSKTYHQYLTMVSIFKDNVEPHNTSRYLKHMVIKDYVNNIQKHINDTPYTISYARL